MNFNLPLVIVNFKAYQESTGVNGQIWPKIFEDWRMRLGVNIAAVCSAGG